MAATPRTKFIWLLVIIIAGTAAAVIYVRANALQPAAKSAEVAVAPVTGVACLGRIEPEDGTVTIGARSLSGQPSLVGELRVKEGDDVEAGQIVAILNSAKQLEAAYQQAETQIKVAELQRDQIKAPAKGADIAAQQAEIDRLEVQLGTAHTDFARIENLFKQGIASQATLDQNRLAVNTTQHSITQAKERLRSLTQVRQVDIDVANAQIQEAMANAERAKAEADSATVRSPYAGRVLKIRAWEGEEVGPNGILELANLDHMYVIAEVAENDIPRVKPGQRATISGESLPQPIEGRVERLGFRVSRNSMTQHDPIGLTDARIVEVRILLDDSSKVKNLIDALVEIRISGTPDRS